MVHKEEWNLDYSDKSTFPVGWRQELSKAEILQRAAWRAFLGKARVPVWKEDCSFLTEDYIQWECSAHLLVPEGDPSDPTDWVSVVAYDPETATAK